MKSSYKLLILALLMAAPFCLSQVTAQQVISRSKSVSYSSSSEGKDDERTPRKVTDEEYKAAFARLNAYIEKALNVNRKDIMLYEFSGYDSVQLTFVLDIDRLDTTIVIPDSVNFPAYLIDDYSATKIKEAMERVNTKQHTVRSREQLQIAERKAKQAARQVKAAERRAKRARKTYSTITISDDDSVQDNRFVVYQSDTKATPHTVKTISRNGKNIEITVDGKSYRFEDGKPVIDSTQTNERKAQRRRERRTSDDDNDDINITINGVTELLGLRSPKWTYKGHWVGVELGFNWLLSPSGGFNLSGDATPMRMNMGSAINWNINFMQYSIPFGTQYFGMVIGLGTNFNFSRFKAKNTMTTGDDHIIFHRNLQDQGHVVKSSRFFSWSLTAPLLFEFQTQHSFLKKFYVAAGVLAHLRLHSSTKILYDKTRTQIESDSFNMHDLSYAATFRIGYGPVRLYSNFYPMGFFESGKGPKVYPIELGVVIIPFT